MNKKVMLSFDLEEFDIPLEYGRRISKALQMEIALQGARQVACLLDELNIRATFFTTAHFAQEYPKFVRQLSVKHEIASHSFNHSGFEVADLQRSREALEDIIGKKVYGFRRPRFAETDIAQIKKAGYEYNSSVNPIWLPGRYNKFFARRRAHYCEGLLNIPISATPVIRFPLFWLSLKNIPQPIIKPASLWALGYDGYLNIFFHPWEFTDCLDEWDLPKLITRCSGAALVDKTKKYVHWLDQKAEFITMGEFRT